MIAIQFLKNMIKMCKMKGDPVSYIFSLVDKDDIKGLEEIYPKYNNTALINDEGHTLLFHAYAMAMYANKSQCFYYILKNLPNTPTFNLFKCIGQNDIEGVKKLLREGANPNGCTAFAYKPDDIKPGVPLNMTRVTSFFQLIDLLALTQNVQIMNVLLANGHTFFNGKNDRNLQEFNKSISHSRKDFDLIKLIHYSAFIKMLAQDMIANVNSPNINSPAVLQSISKLAELEIQAGNYSLLNRIDEFVELTIRTGNTIDMARLLRDGYPADGLGDTTSGAKPIDLAVKYKQGAIIKLLEQYGIEMNAQHRKKWASQSGQSGAAQVESNAELLFSKQPIGKTDVKPELQIEIPAQVENQEKLELEKAKVSGDPKNELPKKSDQPKIIFTLKQ